MEHQALDLLKSIEYFRDVPGEDLEKLAANAIRRSYPRDSHVINKGDDPGALFLVVSGRVRIYRDDDSGRTITLANQDAGTVFGELSLLDGKSRSASAETLEPTVCYLIPRNTFLSWSAGRLDVAQCIIISLANRIRELTEKFADLALLNVYGRLVKKLNEMKIERNDAWVIENFPSQQSLANDLGCAREMVARILRDLKQGGYISTGPRKTLLINRKLPIHW